MSHSCVLLFATLHVYVYVATLRRCIQWLVASGYLLYCIIEIFLFLLFLSCLVIIFGLIFVSTFVALIATALAIAIVMLHNITLYDCMKL